VYGHIALNILDLIGHKNERILNDIDVGLKSSDYFFERDTLELMRSWGFASREGVFAETKEGICRNKNK